MAEPLSLGTFGEVDDDQLAELDDPPIPFTLVGYQVKAEKDGTHPSTPFVFHVKPTQSFGPLFHTLVQADAKGNIPTAAAVQFIGDALIADDRDEFHRTLRDPDFEFFAEALGQMAEALAERYGMRPTQPRAARRSTRPRNGRTSTDARSARA